MVQSVSAVVWCHMASIVASRERSDELQGSEVSRYAISLANKFNVI